MCDKTLIRDTFCDLNSMLLDCAKERAEGIPDMFGEGNIDGAYRLMDQAKVSTQVANRLLDLMKEWRATEFPLESMPAPPSRPVGVPEIVELSKAYTTTEKPVAYIATPDPFRHKDQLSVPTTNSQSGVLAKRKYVPDPATIRELILTTIYNAPEHRLHISRINESVKALLIPHLREEDTVRCKSGVQAWLNRLGTVMETVRFNKWVSIDEKRYYTLTPSGIAESWKYTGEDS